MNKRKAVSKTANKQARGRTNAGEDFSRDGLLCALVVIAALLIAHPVAEMAFVDEWSYVGSSRALAEAHRIAYYGASAMVGWQILWGALAFKLFGYSFTVARVSMLPFAAGVAALMHAVLRGFGIGRRAAVVGTLTVGLSPLALPLEASFMTDIGALFGVLLCLYLCQRALLAGSDRGAVLWLSAAAGTNLVLGTDRQIVWLGLLVMVPGTAWLLRRRRGVPMTAALWWVGGLGAILMMVRWFGHQNNVLPAKLFGPVSVRVLLDGARELLLRLPLCLLLVLLPVAIGALARVRELSRSARVRVALGTLTAMIGLATLGRMGLIEHVLMPWMRPLIGDLGMWRFNDELPGSREVTLGLWSRTLISLVVIATLLTVLELLWAQTKHVSDTQATSSGLGWSSVWLTLGVFSTVYFVLLVPTQLFGSGFYDRYVLFLMPLGLVLLLKFMGERERELPGLCYATLAVFSVYTVMATHDWYALLRAHVGAIDAARAAGASRTEILGGWEYDATTQIEAEDFLNYKQAVRPAGTVYTPTAPRLRPCEQGLTDWTPAIHPRYIVAYTPYPCFPEPAFAPFVYRTWLPPSKRQLYVLKVPEGR